MKHVIVALIAIFIAQINTNAQAPEALTYQAVARNSSGDPLTSQSIALRFSIRNLSAVGAVVYSERQTTTTNSLGQFNVSIGQGIVLSGSFNSIAWGIGSKFLQVEIDVTGGTAYVDMGTQQLLSVPYSLYAKSAGADNAKADKVIGAVNGNFATLNASGNLVDAGRSPSEYLHKTNTTVFIPTADYHPATKKYVDDNVSGASSSWKLTGNAGTNSAVNFLGTTDNQALVFKMNNFRSGFIDNSNRNTSFGFKTFIVLTSGADNIAFGETSLSDLTTGSMNSATGTGALKSTTTGSGNTAMGHQAMYSNVGGMYGTAVGHWAMRFANNSATSFGTFNTAVGYEALKGSITPSNNTGIRNTAVGMQSLSENSTGENNTAMGTSSLASNTTGSANTAMGYASMVNNTTAWYNTAVGTVSMIANVTGQNNTALGYSALYNNVAGHQGTAVGAYAMSNITNTSTSFVNENVAVGYESLKGSFTISSNTGNQNTAIGYHSLFGNSSGSFNTAIGRLALWQNSTGSNNTTNGSEALSSNTVGNRNTSLGCVTMYWNKSGSNATAVGYASMYYCNPTATSFINTNAALGYESLMGSTTPANNTGNDNTALGYQAMRGNSSGSANTAAGNHSLLRNTTGELNTAVGFEALDENITGSNNTAVGAKSFDGIISGSFNTCIGYLAKPSIDNLVNATAIGANTIVAANNSVVLGNNANVGIGCSAPQYKLHVMGDIASNATVRTTNALVTGFISACSDFRFKKQIMPLENSLEKILKLNGVSYYWKGDEFPERNFSDEKQIGLIAQEIEKVYPELVFTDKDGYKSVDYSRLTPILIEAIKELKKENELLADRLQKEIAEIKQQLEMMARK